jgi:Zn-dependent M28 family amino/carboxypeptidase
VRRANIAVLCLIAGLAVFGGALVAVLALTSSEPPPAPPSATREMSASLREAVSPAGIMEHERRLQSIAQQNGGNRAAGTLGYDASAEYVARTLRKAGYRVTVQEFEMPEFAAIQTASLERTVPEAREYTEGADFVPMEHSGDGEVVGEVFPVNAAEGSSSSGCEAGDFEGFREGGVALLRRGECTFEQKARNAEAAGASAALIFDDAPSGPRAFAGTLGGPGTGIPVFGTSFAVGDELLRKARDGGARVRVTVRTAAGSRTTSNVIAEMPGGGAENTVMVGAHLDSVVEGPGINDNGSGSATILEIAETLAKQNIRARNKVRFAFWGAEEIGLVGSRHYVDGLEGAELDAISVYLNFDMVGSPNHVRFVYGSDEVTAVFKDYFATRNLRSTVTPALTGRSDHGPFEEAGVPAGGLFSGAGGTKTGAQARAYGGEAGEAYDPCYHAACDDVGNVDREAVDELSDAAAHAVAVFAQRE